MRLPRPQASPAEPSEHERKRGAVRLRTAPGRVWCPGECACPGVPELAGRRARAAGWGRSWIPACEGAGFVDQLGPPGLIAVADQDPFAEGSARGGERLARARRDELLDAVPGEL